jgi:PemK-like, MazF-like toxin of type II toxin-antitoxin system
LSTDKIWWPAPEAGEIVWCHFPENKGIKPSPKPRPALVIKVFDDNKPCFAVSVIYGTSQKTDQLRSGELLISNRDATAYQHAGLSYSTKFNFHSTVELPYDEEWFKVPPGAPHGQTPILGVLHPSLMLRARAAWAAAASLALDS